MKQAALLLSAGVADPVQRLNLLREYVQAFVLRSLHESEAFHRMAFVGGTALRFLHGLPRFSEDLDFSLLPGADADFLPCMTKLKRDLTYAGFAAEVTWNPRTAVHKGWVKIAGILAETGLSPLPDQKLSVKIEIDTRPPEGAQSAVCMVNRHLLFSVRHHTLPSLFAGKIHALWTREYAKGRDWYDLVWYLTQRPSIEPNLELLRNALRQTHPALARVHARWREHVLARLEAMDANALADDVRPFLERAQDAQWLQNAQLRDVLKANARNPTREITF